MHADAADRVDDVDEAVHADAHPVIGRDAERAGQHLRDQRRTATAGAGFLADVVDLIDAPPAIARNLYVKVARDAEDGHARVGAIHADDHQHVRAPARPAGAVVRAQQQVVVGLAPVEGRADGCGQRRDIVGCRRQQQGAQPVGGRYLGIERAADGEGLDGRAGRVVLLGRNAGQRLVVAGDFEGRLGGHFLRRQLDAALALKDAG